MMDPFQDRMEAAFSVEDFLLVVDAVEWPCSCSVVVAAAISGVAETSDWPMPTKTGVPSDGRARLPPSR